MERQFGTVDWNYTQSAECHRMCTLGGTGPAGFRIKAAGKRGPVSTYGARVNKEVGKWGLPTQ
eukprot:5290276-Amphidinium_carterae.1